MQQIQHTVPIQSANAFALGHYKHKCYSVFTGNSLMNLQITPPQQEQHTPSNPITEGIINRHKQKWINSLPKRRQAFIQLWKLEA